MSLSLSLRRCRSLFIQSTKQIAIRSYIPFKYTVDNTTTTLFRAKKEKKSNNASASVATEESSEPKQEEVIEGKDLKTTLAKQIDYTKRELSKLRGGSTNPNMLDLIPVEAYGEMQSLRDVAQVTMKSAQLLVVNPLDPDLTETISNAIRDAALNLNPSAENNIIRVPIPKTSKETRDAAIKMVAKIAEQAKVRIRKVRADYLDKVKKQTGISEDDIARETKQIEDSIQKANQEITDVSNKKKAEIEVA